MNQLNSITCCIDNQNESFNYFSYDGILKVFSGISVITLTFSLAIRYIITNILLLLFPLALVTLLDKSTSCFFKSYIKTLISLLLLQSLFAIILIVILKINYVPDKFNSLTNSYETQCSEFVKLSYIASLYILTKANNYMKEMFGGISTEFSANIQGLAKMK